MSPNLLKGMSPPSDGRTYDLSSDASFPQASAAIIPDTDGDLVVTYASGNTATVTVKGGAQYPMRITGVTASGTTVTNLHVQWN